jgi:hypothetical protein
MVINTKGNVGIGYSSPWSALGVYETDSSTAIYGRNDQASDYNFGVYGYAAGAGTNNYGLVGKAEGGGTYNYGVYGSAANATSANWAGYFAGNVYVTGHMSVGSFKDRTQFYEGDALSEIAKISGKDGEIDHSTLPKFAYAEQEIPVFEKTELIEILSEEAFETVMVDNVKVFEAEDESGDVLKRKKQIGVKKKSRGYKAENGKIVEDFEETPIYETEQIETRQLRKDVYLDEKTGKVYKKTGEGEVFERDGKIYQQNQTGTRIEEQRDLGAMISILTVAVQQLNEKIETLAAENAILKKQLSK